jgi:hypothetical protein
MVREAKVALQSSILNSVVANSNCLSLQDHYFMQYDYDQQKPYFVNCTTKESTWVLPPGNIFAFLIHVLACLSNV